MRIALVTQGYEVGGGVASVARWLRDGLQRRGHDVHVHDLAASRSDRLSRRILSPASWHRGAGYIQDSLDPSLFRWGANWVELEFQRYQPRRALTEALDTYDAIQVVAGGPALALATLEARVPKYLQVATTLTEERPARLRGMHPLKRGIQQLALPGLARVEVRAMRGVDEIFVENRSMERWTRARTSARVTFAPPGVDVETYRPIGLWDRDAPVIAFGRLHEERKDWPTAIAAYEHFVDETNRGNRMVLAGRGPVPPSLLDRVRSSPVRSRITIREDLPQCELPGFLATGSVFLQSSKEEGLGLAGLEAMACGLPVVATRTAGASEYVVSGENGVLVDLGPGAIEGLAAALARIFRGGIGPEFARRARATVVERYSSEASLDLFEGAYSRSHLRLRARGRPTDRS